MKQRNRMIFTREELNAMKKDVPEFVKGKPHYAFLLLREHPYGNEMLRYIIISN